MGLESSHQKQLSQDLHQLYATKEYADITITCGGKIFKCHKSILASRSPVFAAMFKSNMKEMRTGRVEIKNLTPQVLECLLEYVYTSHASSVKGLGKKKGSKTMLLLRDGFKKKKKSLEFS